MAYPKQKAKLTKKELAWLQELQDVIDRCPSPEKIGFYTIGDPYICLYDRRHDKEIEFVEDDLPRIVAHNGWQFDEFTLDFPSAVNGVCG